MQLHSFKMRFTLVLQLPDPPSTMQELCLCSALCFISPPEFPDPLISSVTAQQGPISFHFALHNLETLYPTLRQAFLLSQLNSPGL